MKGQPKVAIYGRVSGGGQNPEMQIKELQTFLRFYLDFAQGDWIELLPIALLTLKLEALLSEFYPTGRFSRDS